MRNKLISGKMDYSLYFLLVFSAVFTDGVSSDLVRMFGNFGSPILCVVMPIVLIVYITMYRKFSIDNFFKKLIILLSVLFIVNIIADTIYYLTTGISYIYIVSENIFFKSFKGLMYFTYYILYYLLVYNLGKRVSWNKRFIPFVFTFFFLFFVLIVELSTMPYAWPYFHFGARSLIYDRVRLTTHEAAFTVPLIAVFGGLTVYYFKQTKKRVMVFFSLILYFIFVITTGSRTLLVFMLILIIYYFYRFIKKRKSKLQMFEMLLLFVLLPIFAIYGLDYLYGQIFEKSYTSLTTRTLSLLAMPIHSILYPFGTGYSISMITYPPILNKTMNKVSRLKFSNYLHFDYSEIINSYLKNPELGNIGLLGYSRYWGILGTIILFLGFIQLYKKFTQKHSDDLIICGTFIGLVIVITFFINIENCYTLWAFLAIVSILGETDDESLDKQIQ